MEMLHKDCGQDRLGRVDEQENPTTILVQPFGSTFNGRLCPEATGVLPKSKRSRLVLKTSPAWKPQ